jgi:cytochrome c oxidase subunit 1
MIQVFMAPACRWVGERGLDWTVPSTALHLTFTVTTVIREGDLAHGDVNH